MRKQWDHHTTTWVPDGIIIISSNISSTVLLQLLHYRSPVRPSREPFAISALIFHSFINDLRA